MEDKQAICNSLCETLRLTRDQADIREISYLPDIEGVLIEYEAGVRTVNVAFDSGVAMIRDILNAIK